MPDFNGVTPSQRPSPITINFKGADGSVKRTVTALPPSVALTPALISAYVDAKGAISNGGVFKRKADGVTISIPEREATVNDELYDLGTILLCTFQNINDPEDVYFDRTPAPNAGYLNGVALDTAPTTPGNAYVNAFVAILNSGTETYAYVSGTLENIDTARVVPGTVEPVDEEGDPAQPA